MTNENGDATITQEMYDAEVARREKAESKIVTMKSEIKETPTTPTVDDSGAKALEAVQQIQKANFLNGKNLEGDDLQAFEDNLTRGMNYDDAYKVATYETKRIEENQANTNSMDISYKQVSETGVVSENDLESLSQEQYNEVMNKVEAGEIKLKS